VSTKRMLILLLTTAVLAACGSAPADTLDRAGSITAAAQTVAKALEKPDTPTTAPTAPTPTVTPAEISSPAATTQPAPSSTQRVVLPTSACDVSAYVSDVTVPDNTVMDPGETFTKTWKFKNTGECKWTTAYAIAFVSGTAMGGKTTALADAVDPGDEANISVELTAPATAGTYTGYWRLKNASGNFFGDPVFVKIVVPGAGTATVTATSGATVVVPTATVTPTQEPTPTETTAA
jgi:hypothetical protein